MREPLLLFEVQTPEDCLGEVIGEVASRRGAVEEIVGSGPGTLAVASACAPLAEMVGFEQVLARLTRGAARYRETGRRP